VDELPRLWHVVVTVSGPPRPLLEVHEALMRLSSEHPFIHSLRYDSDRAEVSYWEEGDQMVDAASLALRLWSEHRDTADLPAWSVVGLEVVERETFQSRNAVAPLVGATVHPLRF
jgi:hypothetical protein